MTKEQKEALFKLAYKASEAFKAVEVWEQPRYNIAKAADDAYWNVLLVLNLDDAYFRWLKRNELED